MKKQKEKTLLKPKRKENKGITLIALIVTIIVLLILAGVSIATLTGENGILTQAVKSKEQTKIGGEEEAISIAYDGARIGTIKEKVTASKLNEQFTLNGTRAQASGEENIVVVFSDTNNEYVIEQSGKIIPIVVEKVKDTNPGEFNGEGTQESPYLIESIEDLVALATNVNKGKEYTGEYFKITQDLDFYSDKSYVNKEEKYTYNGTIQAYEQNEEGIGIKQLCTTGEGWMPIGGISIEKEFNGIFEGNNTTISNLYINREKFIEPESIWSSSNYIGLLRGINYDSEIKNLSVTGKIVIQETAKSNDENNFFHISGIVGEAQCSTGNVRITNCNNYVNIEGHANIEYSIGGIAGSVFGIIENCNNYGNITVNGVKSSSCGGIVSNINSAPKGEIKNCNNYGYIKVIEEASDKVYDSESGGIVGYNNGSIIEECNNYGNIEIINIIRRVYYVGGITGYNDSWDGHSATIRRCINKGKIKGSNEQGDCYVGGISGYSEKGTIVENSINEGILEANAKNGTVYKDDIVAKVED